MHSFTPLNAVIGGALIATALAIALLATGRIAGLSNIVGGLVRPENDTAWRAWFVAGMLAVGASFRLFAPMVFDSDVRLPLPLVAVAGVLVGVGTRLANGCTSGHGLCGISRGAKRSIIATCVFFAIAVATATIVGAVLR